MRDISSQTSMQSAYGNEKAKSCPGRRSTRCAPAILVWMSAQTAFPPLPPPPQAPLCCPHLVPPSPPHPEVLSLHTYNAHTSNARSPALAHMQTHACMHRSLRTFRPADSSRSLSHMHADTRQRRTASSSFSLPALFTRTHCKKYPFFTLLARHVCKSGLFLQCVQDLAVTLRAEGGLQCMSQWQPQKKNYIWWKLHMKNGVTMKFFCCLFFLSNIQCCAKAWSLLLSLYILFGKWEISEVFIETCKHAWNKVYEGKNRVCAVLMSLKVHIWPPVQ